MEAKQITDHFWILEKSGQRIGILQETEAGVTLTAQQQRLNFKNIKQLKKEVDIKFVTTSSAQPEQEQYNVNDYPTACQPYNCVYDVQKKLPLFTKTDKSKSYYCAGYYIIKFDNGWVKSFCPKLITIQRYKSQGPFRTQIEMQEQLRLARQNDSR